MGQPIHIIKIRRTRRHPGNEYADDIADRVARTDQAAMDLLRWQATTDLNNSGPHREGGRKTT
jgi:ribose 1,5-bisphosphokinase PhnN